MVTAFYFSSLTIYRFPNRFVLTQRKRPYLISSTFLFRITLAAIISSNRNLFTLKLYRHFCHNFFFLCRHVTCVILSSLKLISRYLEQPPASLRTEIASLRHSSASQILLYFAKELEIILHVSNSFRCYYVKTQTSRQVTNLHAESFSYLVHNLWPLFASQITSRHSGAIG